MWQLKRHRIASKKAPCFCRRLERLEDLPLVDYKVEEGARESCVSLVGAAWGFHVASGCPGSVLIGSHALGRQACTSTSVHISS